MAQLSELSKPIKHEDILILIPTWKGETLNYFLVETTKDDLLVCFFVYFSFRKRSDSFFFLFFFVKVGFFLVSYPNTVLDTYF